jgi:PAS domain S-box-containing protein
MASEPVLARRAAALVGMLGGAILMVASSGLAAGKASPPAGVPHWRVLLVQDSDPFLTDSLRVDQAFRAALIEGSDRPIDFIREWSGGDRVSLFDSDKDRLAFLKRKYRRFSVDLIVSMDETGFDFIRRHRAELWPEAPFVFCGVSEADPRTRTRPARSAGVALADEIAGTIDLALDLQPSARTLVVVGAVTDSGAEQARVRDAIARLRRPLVPDFLDAEPVGTLLEKLRAVPPGAIVLYTLSDRDSSRLTARTRDLVDKVSRASRAPLYAPRDLAVGQGAVGGVSSGVEDHGREAAKLALKILGGQEPDSFAVAVTRPLVRADWGQVRRWDLDESKLPADADLRNIQPKLWESHRRQVILTAIAFAGLVAVIVALVLWRADRRVAEERLRKRLAFERILSEISGSVLDVSHDSVHEEVERALARVVESMQLERCALFVLRPGQSQASFTHTAQARSLRAVEVGIGANLLPRLIDALHDGSAVELDDATGNARPGPVDVARARGPLLVPVSRSGETVSGVLFQKGERSRPLPADIASRMLLVGQMLFSALSRRGAETSLRTSEERYRTVVESQADLICRYLPDTTLTFVNEAYCRYFGRNRDELIGHRFVELVPERSRDSARLRVQSLMRNPRVDVDEHEVLRPDGTIGWLQWSDYAIFGRDGRIVEFQGIGRDVTDRKRMQEAEDRLADAARLTVLGELATSIAHEIRQPLGAILSNTEAAEMLLENGLPGERVDEIREILADIHREDLRASAVIQRIRSLMQHHAPSMEPLDVNGVARDVAEFVGPDARRRGAHVELDLTEGLLPVSGDPVQLQQVLLNLAVNALDAMGDTPAGLRRVRIRTYAKEDSVILEVRDSGHGIDPEVLPRLFQSFVTTRRDGLGLGLSLSRSIVEAHGGRITAENNPTRGATFRCILPAEAEALAATRRASGRIA